MFFNKKGDWNTLRKIILALMVGVILLLFLGPLLKGGSRAADITSCKNWAVLQSSAKIPIADIRLKEFSNPCVTLQDELKGDEYEVYEILAMGMYDTWNMYGQGKIDFFSDWNWVGIDSYCFIGDEIKADKKRVININKFEEHLSDNYPPKKEFTYAEFLTGAKRTKLDFGSDNINLEKDDKIYILFTAFKWDGRSFTQALTEGAIVAVGSCALGATKIGGIGAIIGGAAGLGVGSGLTAPTGALVGASIGCIMGMVPGLIYSTGQADELFPGLILISGEDIPSLEKKCDGGLHYKPK